MSHGFFYKHSPEVLVTHTKDLGQVHIAAGKIGGYIDIQTAIAVAQLALKDQENKNLRQRIIVFVASPLVGQGADEQSMVKLAKKAKRRTMWRAVINRSSYHLLRFKKNSFINWVL